MITDGFPGFLDRSYARIAEAPIGIDPESEDDNDHGLHSPLSHGLSLDTPYADYVGSVYISSIT